MTICHIITKFTQLLWTKLSIRLPIGLRLYPSIQSRLSSYRALVLVLTYIAYTTYHLSRRPLSVVKNVFNQNCSQVVVPQDVVITDDNRNNWCDWKPFQGSDANSLLGLLDSSFLFSYAIFMFVSGFVAERCHLRYFLSIGMVLSGVMTFAFGIAYYYDIHSFNYFIAVQIISGAVQTTGWPSVVSSVGNWFGKSSRGLVFGIWNSHTNVGNILGAVIAGYYVETNWGLSFIVPSFVIIAAGLLLFFFFTPYPEEVGISSLDIDSSRKVYDTNSDNYDSLSNTSSSTQQCRRKSKPLEELTDGSELDEAEQQLINDNSITDSTGKQAISFMTALKIPGVIQFSMCLFFAKLVSYTFLYWLPKYIGASTDSSSSSSAYLSTPFDLGGIIGTVLAGILVDKTGASALICTVMLILAIPSLIVYQLFGSTSESFNIVFQIISGTLVNGPYALITTAVSADLGTKVSNSHSLATVTAIIDGTGSLGAALGPFVAGMVSEMGWEYVFYMVYMADFLAVVSISSIAAQEYKRLSFRKNFPVFCDYNIK